MNPSEVKALHEAGHTDESRLARPLYPMAAGVGLVLGLMVLSFSLKPRVKKLRPHLPFQFSIAGEPLVLTDTRSGLTLCLLIPPLRQFIPPRP